MLSKKRKLQLRQFPDFFDHAQKSFHSLFTLFYRQNQTGFLPAVIVPKKAARKATERNTLKRIVYVVIEQNYQQLEHKKISVAIVLKAKGAHTSTEELSTQLLAALSQLWNYKQE